ncbi:MAG: tRNA preQ1(34) S-adenosylmethionine ribosyltransferase-isomerase QueA [Spirochaetes bacterium]|nr:tRNA preQ1(34) S-adenosylmethionine ribosyltransferase-isomerase QueA [Spirochaetota bacterium]
MNDWASVATYDYPFDESLIAQEPLADRSASRLLRLDRATGGCQEARFTDFPGFLNPGDLLVFNDTRVWNARIHGRRQSGGKVEILVTRLREGGEVDCLLKPAKRLPPGEAIALDGAAFLVGPRTPDGATGRLTAPDGAPMAREAVLAWLSAHGELPIPPYIHHQPENPERYQTVYAARLGSAAAPTAGLHFTRPVFEALAERGIEQAFLTLHVGPGTFLPVYGSRLENHLLHEEEYALETSVAERLEAARRSGRRIVAVGTTALRALEDNFRRHGATFAPGRFATRIFIRPPDRPGAVGALLTNFHLPQSTLFMLVCAFGGYEAVKKAYARAVRERFRFFSFGDAMFIA